MVFGFAVTEGRARDVHARPRSSPGCTIPGHWGLYVTAAVCVPAFDEARCPLIGEGGFRP